MKSFLDLERDEIRYFIPENEAGVFLKEISKILVKKEYENEIARTIYLNDEFYSVPWGFSLRARKYLTKFSDRIVADPHEIYNVQVKSEPRPNHRVKVRKDMPLADASAFTEIHLFGKTNGILRPYSANEYHRASFHSAHGNYLRLTFDRDMRYGFFEKGSQEAAICGTESFARIEVKVNPEETNREDVSVLLSLLKSFDCLPVISKREQACNFIALVLDKKGDKEGGGMFKELQDIEAEAKFLVNTAKPEKILSDLREHFIGGREFIVAAHYPYVQETTSVNHYWSGAPEKVNNLKLMFFGDQIKPVLKSNARVVTIDDAVILLRSEIKEQTFCYTPHLFHKYLEDKTKILGPLTYEGCLFRSRKAFWPENTRTGRIYHISIDRCRSQRNHKELWQLEIEYTGRYKKFRNFAVERQREEIIDEIASLVGEVQDFCNLRGYEITSSTLEKFAWLKEK